MVLAQRLEHRQAQGIVMTPQLQQAVALLQFSNLDLAQHLSEQAATNPFLEIVLPEKIPAMPSTGNQRNRTAAPFDLTETLASPYTFSQHLERQIETDIRTPEKRRIARLLLGHLDERGYLDSSWHADMAIRGIPEKAAHAVLAQLQSMDPPGIFAQNLAECLRLQLLDKQALTPELNTLLTHWGDLASGNHRALEKAGIAKTALPQLLAQLKPLHPRPVDGFSSPSSPIFEPDILLRNERGQWRIDLNPNTLPRLIVDRDYHARITGDIRNPDEKSWVAEKIASANWLARALDQRARTMLLITTRIVEAQADFFRHGPQALKPLTLRMVAETAGVHESTVSRVTSGKTISTPRGIFELKYFFPVAMTAHESPSGECSATAIRDAIARLVARETATHVLSDDELVSALASQGMKAARRTIAKYRDALGIPSSYERKRLKQLSC
ncbi:MAG: RNA polymerase sigma-54 factor [Alphaproteobacteria bacterium GWF2_58_20]|nr:MAG: RNA polymerase sigma-54 factor [Alphaproteobacteria bacterium GWF2_58_20]